MVPADGMSDNYGGNVEISAGRMVTTFKRIVSSLTCAVMLLVLIGGALPAGAALATTPATITNVTYKYNNWVKFIDLSGAQLVGGSARIPGAALSAGDVLVDENGQRSLKILKVNADGSYVTTTPTMVDLFSEFEIPRQVIVPTAANITEYAVKGIPAQDYAAILAQQTGQSGTQTLMSGNLPSADMKKMYDLFASRGSTVYRYNGDYTFQSFDMLGGSSSAKLHLEGAVGVSPGIVADYSFSHGYEFGFVDAAQFIDLKALLDVKIDREMYFPIFAVGVSIPKLGGVKLGVYLVLDIDGNITLTIKAEEGIIASASVYGSTKYGVPTSFHTTSGLDTFSGAECDPMGYIHAGMYITPLVSLEILSVDVFDAQLRLGFYTYADFTETTLNYGVDGVVNAFVKILGDKTTLLNKHVPIIERSKSMRPQDDVVFYTSRLCAYQDRLNVAAMTKRPAGSTEPYADPFSDKLPFANRALEIWYYAAGNDAQGGANQNPTKKLAATTDANGCVSIDFAPLGVDIAKGDAVIVKAVGFNGQTDVIRGATPFLTSGTYGYGKLRGDFFEDTVEFNTPSGPDLTVFDVPNAEIQFDTQNRIHYEGPVTVYSTDKTTHVTETATFTANKTDTEYALTKVGTWVIMGQNNAYDIKPNCELCWQIKESGYLYGNQAASGVNGHETTHHVTAKRLTIDQQVPLEDYAGNIIGIQHNVTLHVIAVNTGGDKPFTGSADLYVGLGEVPAEYVQGSLPPVTLGYITTPAAAVRYPNHFEYYSTYPFPVTLYEAADLPKLTLGSAESTSVGTSTQASYRWRWEEIKPDIPETVTVTRAYVIQSPTGAPQTIYKEVTLPNIIRKPPSDMDLSAFSGIPVVYTVTTPSAGVSILDGEAGDVARSIFQMKHIVSNLTVSGIPLDVLFSPPQPIYYDLDQLTPGDANAFNIEFQLEQMRNTDRFVVNPMGDWATGAYRSMASTVKNTAVAPAVKIRNAAALPAWAAGYIHSVVNSGIMELDATGNFPVGKSTTRAQFCAAIVNALGLSALDTTRTGFPFTDITATAPGLTQMQIAYQCGIINGVSATEFKPNALITRQEAATMLMRAFSLRNTGLIPTGTSGTLSRFADRGAVSGYAVGTLEQAVSLSFFSGYPDGTLLPLKNITNEQTAKIVWELKLKAEKPGLQWER